MLAREGSRTLTILDELNAEVADARPVFQHQRHGTCGHADTARSKSLGGELNRHGPIDFCSNGYRRYLRLSALGYENGDNRRQH